MASGRTRDSFGRRGAVATQRPLGQRCVCVPPKDRDPRVLTAVAKAKKPYFHSSLALLCLVLAAQARPRMAKEIDASVVICDQARDLIELLCDGEKFTSVTLKSLDVTLAKLVSRVTPSLLQVYTRSVGTVDDGLCDASNADSGVDCLMRLRKWEDTLNKVDCRSAPSMLRNPYISRSPSPREHFLDH